MILAGGAINSPQLLMVSGVGDSEALARVGVDPVHNLPGVGQNLQDHLDLYVAGHWARCLCGVRCGRGLI